MTKNSFVAEVTFDFQSTKCLPPVNELAEFEKDMMVMVKNIQFRKINNNFQQKLKEDIKDIKSITKVLAPADTSRNIYKLENDQYCKLSKPWKFGRNNLFINALFLSYGNNNLFPQIHLNNRNAFLKI